MALPPPLPWRTRTAPERLIVVLASAAALVGGLLWLGHCAGYGLTTCIWKGVTGFPCAGCGGTRATTLLMGGDVFSAFAMNPAAVVAVCVSLVLTFYAGLVLLFHLEPLRPAFLRAKTLRFGLLVLLGANWVYLLFAGRV